MNFRYKKKNRAALIAVVFLSISLLGSEAAFASSDKEDSVKDDADVSSYDPRPDGTSQVRDQYWGTCWAQAGISTLESYLIKEKLEKNSIQLSVEDALWWAHENWNLPMRDSSGYPATITGYLETVGARSEKDIPYFGEPSKGEKEASQIYGEGENQKPVRYDSAPVLYEVTDIVFLKDATPEEIKELIRKNGAVSASYMATEEGFNEKTSAFWEYYSGPGANHMVSVIGWDDSYPKENFKESQGHFPKKDGAWIVKNSLGTEYGSEGGFIYISYEDGYLFKNDEDANMFFYSIAGARKPVKQKRYMHDQFGAILSIENNEPGTSVWANVFDFGKEERINEISFVSWSAGSIYQIYYAPMVGNTPNGNKSTWKLLSEGKIDHAGYKVVSSGWKEAVPAGKGAIVFSVTGNTQSVGTDEPAFNEGGRPIFNPIQDKGTAFTLENGEFVKVEVEKTMKDLSYTEEPDLCIRAYTVPCR